jgi:hypothetical protein
MTADSPKASKNFKYKIVLDIKKDADNWYAGCNSENFGVDWKTRVSEEIHNNLYGKSKKESFKFLIPFLKQKYIDEKQAIDNHIALLDDIYSKKFNKACKKIIELTGKNLYLNNYTIFITTFPRGPYNFGKGYIWEYIGWNNPAVGFMHELLHFQFHHYWRNNPNSSISKLSEDQFQYFKESLTVILDDSLIPLIEYPDEGYDVHQEFRKELYKYWKTSHNFDDLVDYGLKILPEYCKNTISSFDELKTPSDLLKFMDDNVKYGFVSKNGKKYFEQNEKWNEDWYTKCIIQSGDELLQTKCGTCWDQVELERKWFCGHGYQFKTVFVWFGIQEPSNYPTHTFLAFKKGKKWYWFEHSFEACRGIFGFNSLKELIDYVKSKQLKLAIDLGVATKNDENLITSYEYEKPKDNLGVKGYLNHILGN